MKVIELSPVQGRVESYWASFWLDLRVKVCVLTTYVRKIASDKPCTSTVASQCKRSPLVTLRGRRTNAKTWYHFRAQARLLMSYLKQFTFETQTFLTPSFLPCLVLLATGQLGIWGLDRITLTWTQHKTHVHYWFRTLCSSKEIQDTTYFLNQLTRPFVNT